MSLTGPSAVNTETFRTIEKRFASFSPPINLRDHIVDKPASIADLEVHPLTLQGVDFTVKNPDKFVKEIQAAKIGTEKAFTEGSTRPSDWKQHWAMTTSLLATKGIGFREPWRYYLNDRDMQLANARPPRLSHAPEMDLEFAQPFGAANTLNLSALHISVAYGKWTECNIHIDDTGVAMSDLQNNVSITPGVVGHFFNDLLLKTVIGEHLPTWFIDRVNLHVLSPEMGYERLGVGYDVVKRKSFKVTITASCGLMTCKDVEFSKIFKLDLGAIKSLNPTINLTGRFNLGGG